MPLPPIELKCLVTLLVGLIWIAVWGHAYGWAALSVDPVSLFAVASVVFLHEMWRMWGK